jgi:copper chaperone CopZ
MERAVETKKAILDLKGASCTSCAITIEHVGRRLEGISDIFVDRGTSTIQIEYDGNRESLERICDVVDRIGYEATIRTTE